MSLTYATLEANFVRWAGTQPAVQAAVVVGSRAQGDASDWSDLDVVVFTATPAAYGARPGWLSELGEVWLAVPHRTGRGDPEWQALYAGGLKVDFVLAHADQPATLPALLAESGYRHVFQHGLRSIYDRANDGPAAVLAPMPAPERPAQANDGNAPTAAEYQALVDAALWSAAQVARLLQRGDLWRAKQHCDCGFKQHLLEILVWHAQLRPGAVSPAWDDGRALETWADPAALAALPATFAAYDSADTWRAMAATLDLFLRLARETAGYAGFTYPDTAASTIRGWLQNAASAAASGG